MSTSSTSRWQQIVNERNLDVSVVELKDLKEFNRLDAEYYQRKYLKTEELIAEKDHDFLIELCKKMFRNPMMYGFSYVEQGIPFIRIDDLNNPFIDCENTVFISDETHEKFKSTRLKYNDILMGVRGNTIGRLGIYKGKDDEANMSPNVIFFRLKNPKLADYLSAFLLSSFGDNQIQRATAGTGQPTITSLTLNNLKIPLPSPSLQSTIATLIQTAHSEREKSKTLYQEAEDLLLTELKLKDWQPTKQNWETKDLAAAIGAERMDAEYFQPKYDEIIAKIKAHKGGWDILESLITVSDSQIRPKEEKEYQYCELADIDASSGTVNEMETMKGVDLPSRARMKVKKDDVVVSSVAGSANKVAIISNDADNLVASTGFFVLYAKAFTPEVNLVLMKSSFVRDFLVRSARGMILAATIKRDFKAFPLPKLSKAIQKKITENIQQSHIARAESKALLEKAKRAVEIFIEEDEKKAKEFLKK